MSRESSIQADALVAFKVRNVRSYRDEATLSLQATRLANPEVVRDVMTASAAPERILPVAGLFGANASGKSTILKAMMDMRTLVLGSFRTGGRGTGLRRRPFLLAPAQDTATSEFEIELLLDGVHWQYGFEIDDRRVLREFAYHYPRGRQALVFEREDEGVSFGATFRAAGRALRPLLRENALLLSTFFATNERRFDSHFEWWRRNLPVATSDNRWARTVHTAGLVKADASRGHVLSLLHAADLGLVDIKVVKPDADVLERVRQAMRVLRDEDPSDEELVVEDMIQLVHHGGGRDVAFDPEDESTGTQVWTGLAGPVLDALGSGDVLLVDELDASLHPHLVAGLIDLFQDPRKNPKCAQLIFNAHDTTILGDAGERRSLGRDQIWFTEKDDDGATRLYSLADFRPRRDESIARRYLHGRYGGVPNLDPTGFDRAIEALGAVSSSPRA